MLPPRCLAPRRSAGDPKVRPKSRLVTLILRAVAFHVLPSEISAPRRCSCVPVPPGAKADSGTSRGRPCAVVLARYVPIVGASTILGPGGTAVRDRRKRKFRSAEKNGDQTQSRGVHRAVVLNVSA